jgi:hypothetical protein
VHVFDPHESLDQVERGGLVPSVLSLWGVRT